MDIQCKDFVDGIITRLMLPINDNEGNRIDKIYWCNLVGNITIYDTLDVEVCERIVSIIKVALNIELSPKDFDNSGYLDRLKRYNDSDDEIDSVIYCICGNVTGLIRHLISFWGADVGGFGTLFDFVTYYKECHQMEEMDEDLESICNFVFIIYRIILRSFCKKKALTSEAVNDIVLKALRSRFFCDVYLPVKYYYHTEGDMDKFWPDNLISKAPTIDYCLSEYDMANYKSFDQYIASFRDYKKVLFEEINFKLNFLSLSVESFEVINESFYKQHQICVDIINDVLFCIKKYKDKSKTIERIKSIRKRSTYEQHVFEKKNHTPDIVQSIPFLLKTLDDQIQEYSEFISKIDLILCDRDKVIQKRERLVSMREIASDIFGSEEIYSCDNKEIPSYMNDLEIYDIQLQQCDDMISWLNDLDEKTNILKGKIKQLEERSKSISKQNKIQETSSEADVSQNKMKVMYDQYQFQIDKCSNMLFRLNALVKSTKELEEELKNLDLLSKED